MTLAEPSTIDRSFVPRFRDAVVLVPVQDEAVLFEEDVGALHQLDPIATIVCQLFDGQTAIAQIVDDLAEAFVADRSAIEGDVLTMLRGLGHKGLLHGIQGDESVEDVPEVADDGC